VARYTSYLTAESRTCSIHSETLCSQFTTSNYRRRIDRPATFQHAPGQNGRMRTGRRAAQFYMYVRPRAKYVWNS